MRDNRKEYHATHGSVSGHDIGGQPSSQWELVRELGLDYADDSISDETNLLHSPISAESRPGGECLIVDEGPADRIPPGMECRTLLLSADHNIIYDSRAQGLDDAYGCLAGEKHFAILQRSRRELHVLSYSGELIRSVDLNPISKYRPKIVSWTPRGTFLVAFLSDPCDVDFVELDRHGHVIWSCVESIVTIGIPGSMQLLPDDSFLIADELHHVVWKLGRDGSTRIRWGSWHRPSDSVHDLHRPRYAQVLSDGTLLIADSRNGRILVVDSAGHARTLPVMNRVLFSPSSVRRLQNGNYLICDPGNRCVLELDSLGQVRLKCGLLKVRKRSLTFPRSVQRLGDGRYLVANTSQNSIVEYSHRDVREIPVNSGCKLFWPRAARVTKNKNLLIADGRNFRVLELTPNGDEIRQLKQCRYNGQWVNFEDPHDVRIQPNLNLLVVDSVRNLVLETDWGGQATWVIGLAGDIDLRDPHSAQQLPDGRIMISDTRNHRIVFVDPKTGLHTSITEIKAGTTHYQLCLPRYSEMADDGAIVIADTGNNRVLITDVEFSFIRVVSSIPDSPISHFHFPRWVQALTRDELVISDYGNHRILHLRRREER